MKKISNQDNLNQDMKSMGSAFTLDESYNKK